MGQGMDRTQKIAELNRLYREYSHAVRKVDPLLQDPQEIVNSFRKELNAYKAKLREIPDAHFDNTRNIHY